jgi:hypothetical protein
MTNTAEQNSIQDLVTPDIMGILWITPENLMEKPAPFNSFDYLLDGLLTGHYQRKKDAPMVDEIDSMNFFVTRNFDRPFFIGHIYAMLGNVQQKLDQLMTLASPLRKSRNKVLLINSTGEDHILYLQTHYTEFEFIEDKSIN